MLEGPSCPEHVPLEQVVDGAALEGCTCTLGYAESRAAQAFVARPSKTDNLRRGVDGWHAQMHTPERNAQCNEAFDQSAEDGAQVVAVASFSENPVDQIGHVALCCRHMPVVLGCGEK